MIASIASYVMSYAISFLLTPYIVKELGVAAYGFVGLSSQIIGYTTLLTVALNSMAGRFVTIEYHKGDYERANKYFSSVFFSNCIISSFLLVVSCGLCIYLDLVINIPSELMIDVKLLFAFMALNSVLGLVTSGFGVSTFIKNRLDYSNIRSVIGNIIRAIVLVFLFAVFSPKVWFFGVTAIITTLYVVITNVRFMRKLTPELSIGRKYFDTGCIKELIASGSWNLVTRFSLILESGLNLLIANLFVGPVLAGVYALCTTLPMIVNSVCATIASNFAPTWTQLYATGEKEKMLHELFKSIRIMGFFSSIPIALFAVYGETFYKLWLPTQDSTLLYWLAVAGSIVMIVAMPLEPLWNIFTITNRVKESSINLLEWSIAMFVCVVAGMYITEDNLVRIFIIASVKSILATFRTLTFLPIKGSEYLGFNKRTFYPSILRNVGCLAVIISVGVVIKMAFIPDSWVGLFIGSAVTVLIGIAFNWIISLNEGDREYIKLRLRRK